MVGTPSAIRIDHLAKRYGDRQILSDVSLSVDAGQIVALLGPNGAGKTTTVEILEGYRTADGGRVEVLGQDPATGGPELRARVGIMLQDGGMDPRARPRELLSLYRKLHGDGRDPDASLDLVGLRGVADTPYRRLSGGERQRLALALSLVGRPEVLILDEPTAGMDPEARRTTRDLIAGLRDEGLAILMTTHDLTDVERLADRVAILHGGRIVADGPLDALTGGAVAATEIRIRIEQTPDEAATRALLALLGPGASFEADTEHPGSGRHVVTGTAADPATVAAIAAWAAERRLRILELRVATPTLEERYFALTADVADGESPQ